MADKPDKPTKPEEYRGKRWALQIDGQTVKAKPILKEIGKGEYQKEYTQHGVNVIRGRLRSGDDQDYLDSIGLRIFSEASSAKVKE